MLNSETPDPREVLKRKSAKDPRASGQRSACTENGFNCVPAVNTDGSEMSGEEPEGRTQRMLSSSLFFLKCLHSRHAKRRQNTLNCVILLRAWLNYSRLGREREREEGVRSEEALLHANRLAPLQ